MTKQELIDKAIADGYEAEMKDGLPYIYGVYKKVAKFVKSVGYKGSWGTMERRVEYDGKRSG